MNGFLYKTFFPVASAFLFCIGLVSCENKSVNTLNGLAETALSFGEDKGILSERESESEKDKKIANASDSLKFKEHWVFYVDYSGSMVSPSPKYNNNSVLYKGKTQSLMEHVKEQLAIAIPKMKTEGELSVDIISFYDESLPMQVHNIRKFGKLFEEKDINRVENFIKHIEAKPGKYYTHHYLAIEDFINRCNSEEYKDWVNVMVLLTDGKDEADETPGKNVKTGLTAMNGWRKDKVHKWYGVFVDLKGNINDGLALYFNDHNEKNLFKWNGLDFNFNFFNIKNRREIAYRKDSVLFIPHSGNAPQNISFDPNVLKTILSDGFYNYTLSQPINKGDTAKYFSIKVQPFSEEVILEDKTEIEIPLYYNWGDSKTNNIPDRDVLYLTVFDDKSPMIAINIENGEQKIKYYNKWFFSWGEEHSDTTKNIYIKYLLDKDAVKSPTPCRIEICNVPNYMYLLDEKGNILRNNVLELEKKEIGTVVLRATITPDSLKGNHVDTLNLLVLDANAYNTIIINNDRIENGGFIEKVIVIKSIERWHPITICLFWLILILLILWLLYMALTKAYRAMQPKFKIPALQFSTIPDNSDHNIDPNTFIFAEKLKAHLSDYIRCVRLDVRIPNNKSNHTTWGLHNWWNFKLALKGDIHEYHLASNIFAQVIELMPSYNGIKVYIDGEYKCELSELYKDYLIKQKRNDILQVRGYKPETKSK